MMDDYPWDKVEETKSFISNLYSGKETERPAAIVHPALTDRPSAPPPTGLDERQREVWQAQEGLRRRPIGGDDFVPTLGTGAGTCALATAFGCVESQAAGVYWVEPSITSMEQIDALRKPPVTDGKLGQVLEQTRAYAACADPRLSIRTMDFQSPFTTVEQILGSDRFFLMPYDEPKRLHAIMDIVTDFTIEFFTAQIAAAGPNCCPGIWPSFWYPRSAGIQMADDNLVNVSSEIYAEFVVPYNNRISKAFGGLFLHSCTIKEPHLQVLHELKGLTGINCDISTSVSPARLLEEFGDKIVVAPHAYINTDTNFKNYTEFTEMVLAGWRSGKKLFMYPCVVLYQPDTSKEIPFNEAETRTVLERIPGWRKDHGKYSLNYDVQ